MSGYSQEKGSSAVPPMPGFVSKDSMPEDVKLTYYKMLQAVKKKDFELLKQLFKESTSFKGNWGNLERNEKEQYWSSLLNHQGDVLHHLKILLDGPAYYYDSLYIWPAFIEIPIDQLEETQRKKIIELVGKDQYATMNRAGNYYIGPRIAINIKGEWVAYLTGD